MSRSRLCRGAQRHTYTFYTQYREYKIKQQFRRLVVPLALIFISAVLALCHKTLDTPDIIAKTRDTQLPLTMGFPLTVVVDAITESSEVTFVVVTHSAKLTIISKILSFLLQIISNFKEVLHEITLIT